MSVPRTYGPFGQHDNEAYQAPMPGFNGEWYDPLTGTYALGLGYRSYSPTLMRFVGPDELSPFLEGGLNTYAYCKNDPVNYRDGTGHAPTPAQLQAGRRRLKPIAHVQTELKPIIKKPLEKTDTPSVKSSQQKKNVSFAKNTVFEHDRYQERKKLTNDLSNMHMFNELVYSDLHHLWSPETRQNYRTATLYDSYRRRLSSVNDTAYKLQIEKEAIQQRLNEIRW
ncbi:RHS repeat-associated core domain-containing protein [Pseudomonas sp. NPDC089547]|uniref:RHS repeat-associated core domain-containing protein n=1 Tax=Pseudomonas sp. NPDC089547 TaxID=3390652 RepID=UPI003D04DCB4